MNRIDIYSKCAPGRLLHVHASSADLPYGRFDISDKSEPLQLSIIHGEPGKSFAPHYHIPKACPPEHVTQECWIVIKGAVLIAYYDLDGTFLQSQWISAGECSITYRGGHGYDIADEPDTVAFEVKSGPYGGQKLDKVWL